MIDENNIKEENIVMRRIRDAIRMINQRSGYGSLNILVQQGKVKFLETTVKEKDFLESRDGINNN